ncbi:MAG: class A beta-lactamase [Pseudomonadota bacterium]
MPLELILTRRRAVLSIAAVPLLPACETLGSSVPDFADLERDHNGRLGIAAMDIASGRELTHRPEERFAFCSSFKWLLGALVLARIDTGKEDLARPVLLDPKDLVSYSPVTKPRLGETMTLGELCAATIMTSDNTAANLLITELGGPAGFTSTLRSYGDEVTRLDRYETALNENAPGDPRDTTSPRAMLNLMRIFLFGDALTPASRSLLRQWMIDATTGLDRLRAGLPAGWIAGDKTGTSANDQSNDVAFAVPPDVSSQGPILIVSFANVPNPFDGSTNALHAEVARRAAREFGV